MTSRYLSAPSPQEELLAGFARIRDELDVPTAFSPQALHDAQEAADRTPPSDCDATHLEFVTIDPPGAMDLDQAVCIERRGSGYRIHYAIADVPGFVKSGSALDVEVRARGMTLYSPDEKVPLHPTVLSEDAASLLPDAVRSALIWTIDLDSDADVSTSHVRRGIVRSRQKLSYESVQRALDAGQASDSVRLLQEVGRLLEQQERDRGGVSLPGAEQEIISEGDRFRLVMRAPLAVEGWNAQISLLTGRVAAQMMLEARVGILRTMPEPSSQDIGRVRSVARSLSIVWEPTETYSQVIARLDPEKPAEAAFLNACPVLLRGAGYTPFVGSLPALTTHSAVAAPYAHVTAPLRRLVDRWGLQVCLSLCADQDVPDWVLNSLSEVPELMTVGGRRARELERANVDLVEAFVLRDLVGETFEAVVLDSRENGCLIQLEEPAVLARAKGQLPIGARVQVRLQSVDLARRIVAFVPADSVDVAG